MLRFTLATALSLLLLFALLSTASIAVSSTQPLNPALSGFARCDYGGWCWFGIRPGVTTVREADQLLRDAGYERVKLRHYIAPTESGVCDVRISPEAEDFETIEWISLFCSGHGIRVGDLMRIIGDPRGIGVYEPSPYGNLSYYPSPPIFIFDNAAIIMPSRTYKLDFLLSELENIVVGSLNRVIVNAWENFNDYNFCRSEPTTIGCW